MKELENEDKCLFKNFLRVDPNMFRELVDRLNARLQKHDTWFRKALEPGLKLAITLRYLATEESHKSLMHGFRIAHSTISILGPEFCESIITGYADQVILCPTTTHEWEQIAEQFRVRWNLELCSWCFGWKTYCCKVSSEWRFTLLQLQRISLLFLMGLVDADY